MRTNSMGPPHKPDTAACVGRGGAAERVNFRVRTEMNDAKLAPTMGSLFDGIGGFPLAAIHNGIVPVWASEIEAFPIEVTRLRFPDMVHVGDITKLDGAEPVSYTHLDVYKRQVMMIVVLAMVCLTATTAFAAGTGDVAGAVESTWTTASAQIKTVVNNVVFPAIDLILAVFFFAKLGTAYFEYRKSGQFEWAAPAILFACLVFTLTAPMYLWDIVGI